jgi:cytochrome c-type biogenesis protein CcmH/NrfF
MLMRFGRRGIPILAACLLLGALVPAAAGAAGDPEGWSYTAWRELMSPFCPGRSLADCPSSQADSLRMWILSQEAAGRTREDVEAELLDRYGDIILSAPRAEGFGLTAYVVPVVVFVAGGLLVGVFLWRHTRRGADPGRDSDAPTAPLDPELVERIERELAS